MTLEERAAAFLSARNLWQSVFLSVQPEEILAAARAADDRIRRGQKLGVVDGLFLAVKANVDIRGFVSHAGSLAYTPKPALTDAPIVSRLRTAGAVVLGHVNMSEFAFSGLGVNPHFGTAPNALENTLVPGGSSSGSASAVAMGLADCAIGTDTSGSVRVPAACQGIIGFRPTMGRYPGQGVVPLAPSLDTPGLLTQNVSQLLALDGAITGKFQKGRICDQFIGLDDASLEPFSSDMRRMYHQLLGRLQGHCGQLHRCNIQSFHSISDLFEAQGTLVGAEAVQQIGPLIQSKLDKVDLNVRQRLEQSSKISPESYEILISERGRIQALFEAELSDKLIIYPTLLSKPPALETVNTDANLFAQENAQILKYPMYAAFLNAPTVSLPMQGGSPGAALSISAVSGRDNDVLETASWLTSILADQSIQ